MCHRTPKPSQKAHESMTTATGIAETHGTTQHFSPLLMEIYGDLMAICGDFMDINGDLVVIYW
jgi:hypothetical protein